MSEPGHSYIKRLEHDTLRWAESGIISHEQRRRILEPYQDTLDVERQAGPGKLVVTLSVLGAVLVGLGVILFIASNWSAIPKWGKLAIIFGSMLGSYGSGYFLRHVKKSYPAVGAALILLGAIIYGAGIYLIAQIYNLHSHYPNGLLMWGAGVLPLAYVLGLRSLLVLCLLELMLWLGMEASFRIESIARYNDTLVYLTLYLCAGLVLWVAGMAHEGSSGRLRKFSGPYIVFGLLMALGAWFPFTFDIYGGELFNPGLSGFYYLMAAVFVLALLIALWRADRADSWWWTGFAALLTVSFGLLPLLFTYGPLEGLMLIITNLLYGSSIVGLIMAGYLKRQTSYINTGLLFFIAFVTARYFDFLWGLLPRSLFFILGGLLLLFGGVFIEKKRRRLLKKIRAERKSRDNSAPEGELYL